MWLTLCCIVKKYIRSSSELLSNNSLFGGQLWRSSNHERVARVIYLRTTVRQWIITQQFTHWSWSISILIHNKRRKHIRSLKLLPTFRHCTEELPPILRLRRIRWHVIVTSFKRKNDVTPSNAMNDVIFQWRQLSHILAVNYCLIYHSLLPLAL